MGLIQEDQSTTRVRGSTRKTIPGCRELGREFVARGARVEAGAPAGGG